VNQDLYWRDGNGHLRSYRTSVVDQSSPGNSPLSQEIRRLLDYDSTDMLDSSSTIYFNNRLLFLASPYYNTLGRVSFKDIATLNFSPVSLMSGKGPQIYEGEWDGINGFTDLLKGYIQDRERAFVVSTDKYGHNHLWEIGDHKTPTGDEKLSIDGDDVVKVNQPIQSAMVTRKYDWSVDQSLKTLCRMDLFLNNLQGAGEITLFYRKDEDLEWHRWDSWTWDVNMTSDSAPQNIQRQNRAALKTRYPDETSRGIDGLYPYTGYAFQFRFEWTGYCQISRFMVLAELNREGYSNDRDMVTFDTVTDTFNLREHKYEVDPQNLEILTDENGDPLHDERFVTLTTPKL
jgi:hypothetical protein